MGSRIRKKIAAGANKKELKKLYLLIQRLGAYVTEHETNTVTMFKVMIEALDCEKEVKEILERRLEKQKAAEAAGKPEALEGEPK